MNKTTLRPDLIQIAGLIKPETRVLELGCGTGELLHYLTQHKQVDGRGIELSQAGVSACVKNGLSVIQGNAEVDLKHYPDHCFDYVVSSQVLQATHNPKEVLNQMLRVGKHVIVSIPNFGHWRNRFYLALKGKMPVTKALSYQWYETPNIHFCTIKDFEVLCQELHAVVIKKKFLDDQGYCVSFISRLFAPNWFAQKGLYLMTLPKP